MRTAQIKRRAKECRSQVSLEAWLWRTPTLGAVHGFAGPLGGMLHAPHGALCARLLPLVMETNIGALETRQPEHPALGRYSEIASLLTGDKEATAQEGVKWTDELVKNSKNPGLSTYGMSEKRIFRKRWTRP